MIESRTAVRVARPTPSAPPVARRPEAQEMIATMMPKTKAFTSVLKSLGAPEKVLVLVNEADETLLRATGNLQGVKLALPESVNAYDLLKYRHLLATKDALGRLQEVLSR